MDAYRPLPADPVGYAVEPETGIVHRRYAAHAVGYPRTRLASGVWAIVGRDPIPCPECFGPAAPVHAITADDLELLPPTPAPRWHRRRPPVDPIELPPFDPGLMDTLAEPVEAEGSVVIQAPDQDPDDVGEAEA